MTELSIKQGVFEFPLFTEGPLPDPQPILPDEAHVIDGILQNLESWNYQELSPQPAFIDLTAPNYAHLFNPRTFEEQSALRISPRTHEEFGTVLIRSKPFLDDRTNIISILEYLKALNAQSVYVFEDPSEDKQTEKRERILKTAGFGREAKIHTDTPLTVWEGKAEQKEEKQVLDRPALEFETVQEMVIPTEVKHSPLLAQRPDGAVLYIDSANPNLATVVDPNTWKPKIKDGKPIKLTVTDIMRKVSAIIYHTPPRKPDQEDLVEAGLTYAAMLLRNDVPKKEEGIITEHHLGAMFIVEDKGEDTGKLWREQFLSDRGLVNSIGDREEAKKIKIEETDRYMISSGRVAKKHSPVNLLKSRNGGYFEDQINEGIRRLEDQGYEVDATSLWNEAKKSVVPPETIGRIHDTANVTVVNQSTRSSIKQEGGSTFNSPASNDDYAEAPVVRKTHFKPPRMGTINDPDFRTAVLNPNRVIQTHHICFKCRSEGNHANLSYMEYADPDKKANFVALICPTHGKRLSYPAPTPSDVQDFEKSHTK